VRLHPSICRLLLSRGQPWEWSHADLRELDPELYAHKIKYASRSQFTYDLGEGH
jgi:hypothetical protein